MGPAPAGPAERYHAPPRTGRPGSWSDWLGHGALGQRLAALGAGCRLAHRVRARIGDGQPLGAVFIGRRPTGEVWTRALAEQFPERDWILTRILWLCGEQVGFNRGGRVDSQRRYIYLHGTGDDQPMGAPLSHGCIRLRNADMLELFERTPVGCSVQIDAQ